MAQRLLKAVNTNLRRYRVDANITAEKMISDREMLKKYTLSDDLQKFMIGIRASPIYWTNKRKEAFSMVRQFGFAQLFFTFSLSERDEPTLILMLEKYLNNNNCFTLEDAEKLIKESYDDKNPDKRNKAKLRICELISRDPVTVARWNENRLALITSYVVHPNGIFFFSYPTHCNIIV